jgi:hypothetical protein
MKNWRSLLYGYTGVCIVAGLWTPILWYTSEMRVFYHMETFDFRAMHWVSMLVYVVLALATLWASPGFPDTSNDMMWTGESHGEHEKALHGRVQA